MRRPVLTKKFQTQNGFTLIELVVVMGLFSFVAITMTDILASIVNSRINSEASSIVQQDSTYLLSRISYDIARASTINLPSSAGNSSTNLNLTIDGTVYQYALNGTGLELTVGSSTDRLNHSDSTISNLVFTRRGNGDGKDTITFQFTVTSIAMDSGRNQESRTYSATVGMK